MGICADISEEGLFTQRVSQFSVIVALWRQPGNWDQGLLLNG